MGVEREEVAEVVDPGTIDRIEAVVFDANAFGRDALLNLDLLRTWARDLKSADKQLWLPEPVLWELAAHTADVIDEVRGQLGMADRRIRQSGLEGPMVPAWGIREEIVSTLVDKVYEIDNLEVIEWLRSLNPPHARPLSHREPVPRPRASPLHDPDRVRHSETWRTR